VKVGPYFLDGHFVRRVTHPDQLVIAGVIVLRKVDVVLPEEVISDYPLGWMDDGREILEGEKL
jgi:hypothetical protein